MYNQTILKVVGLVAIVGILGVAYAVTRPSSWSPNGYTPEDVFLPTDQTPVEATTTPATPRPRLDYQAAVKKYSYRVQFNEACQASPANLTVKNGSVVMFDTRGVGRHTLTIGGKTYTFNGAGFALVTLSSKTLPHTVQIDCGTGKNNANIVLQK
jgi:hypothetical protein